MTTSLTSLAAGPTPLHSAVPAPRRPDPSEALAPMVEVWFQMLCDHVPDENLRCVACTHGGTGVRATPWPCALRTVADGARRRHAAARGISVPDPRLSLQARQLPRRRRIRGLHGITRMLTPREQEYLQLAADGYHDDAIADRLCIAERTVGASIRRLARSLGARDRATLLVMALREGVIG